MSKLAILSAFILLAAHLPGGLAGPAMVKKQLENRHVDAALEARQTVVATVTAGVTTVVRGVTTVVGGGTTVVGRDLPVETPAPVPSAVAPPPPDLDARQESVISVIGGLSSAVGDALAPSSTADLEARQAVVTSVVGGVTSVVGGVTSVVGGVTSVVGGVTSVLGGVTSLIGGILAVETAAPVPTGVAPPPVLDARQESIISVIGGRVTSVVEGAPAPTSAVEDLEARQAVTSVVGGVTSVVGGVTTVVGGVTSVVGGVTSVVGGVLAAETSVTSVLGKVGAVTTNAKAIPTQPVQQ